MYIIIKYSVGSITIQKNVLTNFKFFCIKIKVGRIKKVINNWRTKCG